MLRHCTWNNADFEVQLHGGVNKFRQARCISCNASCIAHCTVIICYVTVGYCISSSFYRRPTADKPVIPSFSLTGSVLNRRHGLATFVHERLEWSLDDQSPEKSETECLCADVAGYQIISVYTPPRCDLHLEYPNVPTPILYVGDFNSQHINWGYSKTEPGLLGKSQQPLASVRIKVEQPVSLLINWMLAPTRIWPLRVLARTNNCRTDVV